MDYEQNIIVFIKSLKRLTKHKINSDLKVLIEGYLKTEVVALPEEGEKILSETCSRKALQLMFDRSYNWTRDVYCKALKCLSEHVANFENTFSVLYCFPQSRLDIVLLAIEGEINHQIKYILLAKLLQIQPDLIQSCLIHFDTDKSPWSTKIESRQTPKKRKLNKSFKIDDLDIAECCWTILRTSFINFKDKWNWTEFMRNFIFHNNKQVVWVASQCVSKLLGTNEIIFKYLTEEEHEKYSLIYSKQFVDSEYVFDDNVHSDIKSSLIDQNNGDKTKDLSKSTINVAGIHLPIYNISSQEKTGCLIPVQSTCNNLRNIALGISASKAICIMGNVGSGKSALVDHLAKLTGRVNNRELLKVQLGEETDSKLLLGTYKCTDLPGEFIWEPGVLTKAVLGGHWLLIEDIESASNDVASILASLLENKLVNIPGFRDNVPVKPGFQLFMTHRLLPGLHTSHRKQTNATELLEKYWLQVNVEPLSFDDLVQIIQTKYPVLKTIASRMVTVFTMFSLGNEGPGNNSTDIILNQSGRRLISTRDLMKWCIRAQNDFDVSSQESALNVLQDAIDIFCYSFREQDIRLQLASNVAACLGIVKTKAQYFCNLYKAHIDLTDSSCIAGRATLERVENTDLSRLSPLNFAFTRESCCLLERIAMCLSFDEPVLLVGETGTGKTSTIQLLAERTGNQLIVINMNQQSDSSDLLGGFKPVDMKQVILPLRDEFEALFRSFFNVKENLKFLENISVCTSKRMWTTLLKLMSHSQAAAVKRLTEGKQSNSVKLVKWKALGEKIYRLQTQLTKSKSIMAFSFIEGSLVKALRSGQWVLLDEINLASAETLQCLSGLLEGSTGSVSLLERGDNVEIPRHPNFRLLAAMNPATDFGKKDLPLGIRNRFTELFVSEHSDSNDLGLLVQCYLPNLDPSRVVAVVQFYLDVKKKALEILSDSTGHKPLYSLRTLCRGLRIAAANKCGTAKRSLYEALCLSFLTQLNAQSHNIVKSMIANAVLDKSDLKAILNQSIPEPLPRGSHTPFEGYWIMRGPNPPKTPKKYLLTKSVRKNLCDISRCVSLSNHPVLIQGETSVGKTSLIIYLAESSGHKCYRINNHQHTDLQEYVGSYIADPTTGNLVFHEGVLVDAMRNGHWIILDELNLAPSEVLEALNRVLDDNRELFIAETQTTIKAHPNFRLFATQNPPGLYGGRKMLSRAFRNRFVELHFDEIPASELVEILHYRCDMPESYCKKLVAVMSDLQMRRRGSAAFAGKQGFITLRDLFRWGERYRLANIIESNKYYDWDQHIADEGYLVLAGRVRKEEESETIREVIKNKIKRTVTLDRLFTLNNETSPVTKHILENILNSPLPEKFKHIVWTFNIRKLAVLVGKALQFHEPVLLVGETGCGKTSVCELLTAINNQILYSVNCHQHSESADFLGGLRPVRDKTEQKGKLFEWVDGPLIEAMKGGQVFLSDEISLADDSVLERLNSLLEPERKLLVSEKGVGEDIEITAHKNFRFIGTMNPGGDFGKKELSPALRNRLTEIWCEPPTSQEDLIKIIEHNVSKGLSLANQQDGSSGIGKALVQFIQWFKSTEIGKRIVVSVRDILTWVNFINLVAVHDDYSEYQHGLDVATAYIHGACLTLLDGIGTASTAMENMDILIAFKKLCEEFLLNQVDVDLGSAPYPFSTNLVISNTETTFGIHPFFIEKGSSQYFGRIDFLFEAPTTCLNTLRLIRSLQIPSRAILLEGSPGVGKTSVVMALAKATNNQVTRINLSDQTDISDLFGADLPVEGAAGGTFAWRDGPFLKALKEGHWILLDELNLASQSVVEGLNSVLDHRGEVFIPELGKTFQLKKGTTRLFGCQNPQRQGGSRKGLPQSFLNRFTQVFMESLSKKDYQIILHGLYPNTNSDIINKMVEFNVQLNNRLKKDWVLHSGPWEWNLRDLVYWMKTVENDDPGRFISTIYADRLRKIEDKQKVLSLYSSIFEPKYPLVDTTPPLVLTKDEVIFGEVSLPRNNQDETGSIRFTVDKSNQLLILRNQLSLLRSLALCVKKSWLAILVGDSHSGKSCGIHTLAQLLGQKLYTIPVSSATDTTELLGGFEQRMTTFKMFSSHFISCKNFIHLLIIRTSNFDKILNYEENERTIFVFIFLSILIKSQSFRSILVLSIHFAEYITSLFLLKCYFYFLLSINLSKVIFYSVMLNLLSSK